MSAKPEVQDTTSAPVYEAYLYALRRVDRVMLEEDVIPREVAERLAEVLATIAADTDKPRFPEDPAQGLAWRVKLAHEAEREYRSAYPDPGDGVQLSIPHRAEEA